MVVRGGFKAFIHVQACQLAARGVDCKEIGIPIGLTEALSYRAIIISVSSLPEFPVIGGIALYVSQCQSGTLGEYSTSETLMNEAAVRSTERDSWGSGRSTVQACGELYRNGLLLKIWNDPIPAPPINCLRGKSRFAQSPR
ncbi:hypothetical protein AXG93_531s1300 [Marchantia polymorpha subsp. ruderalis]|uniref:Uncharacterized protein n=1 Tax=Marchantia polymorpha subsp. ruderalis TaxID=1480154 RepID=A0A176VS15_MARPO|nr:hypothetical protein AXG93_531s1300 [Marchantia polymorpha subsp. ruderalis]